MGLISNILFHCLLKYILNLLHWVPNFTLNVDYSISSLQFTKERNWPAQEGCMYWKGSEVLCQHLTEAPAHHSPVSRAGLQGTARSYWTLKTVPGFRLTICLLLWTVGREGSWSVVLEEHDVSQTNIAPDRCCALLGSSLVSGFCCICSD